MRLPPFAAVPYEIINTKVFAGLTGSAVKVLVVCLGKPKIPYTDPFYRTNTWTFPYREAQRYGIAAGTFRRCIVELETAGFIETVRPGLAFEDQRRATLFRLSDRWKEASAKIRIASKTEPNRFNCGVKLTPRLAMVAPILESWGPL